MRTIYTVDFRELWRTALDENLTFPVDEIQKQILADVLQSLGYHLNMATTVWGIYGSDYQIYRQLLNQSLLQITLGIPSTAKVDLLIVLPGRYELIFTH